MDERVSHSARRADEDGGQDNGGKDRIWPFGKFESAMDMPAIWYLFSQWLKRTKRQNGNRTMETRETSSQHRKFETIGTFLQ